MMYLMTMGSLDSYESIKLFNNIILLKIYQSTSFTLYQKKYHFSIVTSKNSTTFAMQMRNIAIEM